MGVEAFGGDVAINAETSRQLRHVPEMIATITHPIDGFVVIHIGTNGTFSPAEFDAVMEALPEAKAVYFVNAKMPRRWQDPVNEALTVAVARTDKAHLIDWHGASVDHPEYFVRDKVHLSHQGQAAYAELLATEVPEP